jgi:hypothetical protein
MDVEDELRVIAVIGVEGLTFDRRLIGVVIREFRESVEVEPVVLLVVAVDLEALFNNLIHSLRLSVHLRVKGGV